MTLSSFEDERERRGLARASLIEDDWKEEEGEGEEEEEEEEEEEGSEIDAPAVDGAAM